MVLAMHWYAGFHNESKGRIWAGAHIFLAEDEPIPRWNEPILTISQVIKFLLSSAVKSELLSISVTEKLVPMRQTLIEMGWPQPPTPIQTDNSMASGVLNDTIIARKNKSMDLRFHWLRCSEAQQQFCFYWDPGSNNWFNYITKHHPSI